ncbi:hypothetical protein [Kluyvera sichuanensis]|uniref:hypothetical protein n=1 Tax=Kluyvera sichuanensis TaxID=2725494 RepID=UPI002FD62B83
MKKAILLLTLCAASLPCQARDWGNFIKKVEDADPLTIQKLPGTVNKIGDSLSDRDAIELATAISFALLLDPANVLKATDEIGKNTDELIQRFDSEMICSVPMMNSQYTLEEMEEYYDQATISLKKAGKPGTDCLKNMQDTMAELRTMPSTK